MQRQKPQSLIKTILLWPVATPLSLIRFILKILWLILSRLYSINLKIVHRILITCKKPKEENNKNEQTDNSKDSLSQENWTHDQKDKKASFFQKLSRLIKKLSNFKLFDLQQQIAEKLKAREQRIIKFVSEFFPQHLVMLDIKNVQQTKNDVLKKSSNQVLIEIKPIKQKGSKKDLNRSNKKNQIKQSRVYYVPTYLRVKLKNFTAIDLDKLQAEVNADLIISFLYGHEELITIPKEVAVRLLDEVVLNFERDEPLKLNESENVHISIKQDTKNYHIQFTVRKKLHMRIDSKIYYTPFQQLDLILPITIQQLLPATVTAKELNELTGVQEEVCYEASVKFNYMDQEAHFVKLDYTDEKHFGYYSLIETGLDARYNYKRITSINQLEDKEKEKDKGKSEGTKPVNQKGKKAKIQQPNEQKELLLSSTHKSNKKKEQNTKGLSANTNGSTQKDKYFQYSFFKIPIYKHPMASLVMIFLPLWSLAIINLGIFFQQNSLNQRIASIASLMIAFIALNQTIRSQIPPHPKVVFVQLLVYAQIIACFLCLVNSYQVSQLEAENYRMKWTDCNTFLISLTIFLTEITVIVLMTLHHYYVMVPSYELSKAKPKFQKINTRKWRNKYCDHYFKELIESTAKIVTEHKGHTGGRKLKDIKDDKKSQDVLPKNVIPYLLNSVISVAKNNDSSTGSSPRIQNKQFKRTESYINQSQALKILENLALKQNSAKSNS